MVSALHLLILVTLWFAALQACAWIIWPLLRRIFWFLPDEGRGLSKPLGILTIGWLSWAAAVLIKIPANALSILLICGALGWGIRLLRPQQAALSGRKNAVFIEGVFAIAFMGSLLIRAFQPEIFWGEKPMDFTFLNFLVRNETFPAQDPWAAGHVMRYYYLGTYLYAAIVKVIQTPGPYAYNFALISIPPAIVSVLGSLFLLFGWTRRKTTVALAVFFFAAPWETLRLIYLGHRINFDSFWATTRILKPAMATEYPLWSYLFGDLHAHVIAIPYSLIALTIFVALLLQRIPVKAVTGVCLVLGFVLGALAAVNSWDLIAFGAIGVLTAVFIVTQGHYGAITLARGVIAATITAAIAFIPFIPTLGDSGAPGGFEREGFNNLWEMSRCLGQFLVAAFAGLALFDFQRLSQSQSKGPPIGRNLVVAIILVGTMGAIWSFQGFNGSLVRLPWTIFVIAAACVVYGCSHVEDSQASECRVAGYFLALGGFGVGVVEMFWLNDRMNTLFKFYYPIWILLALSMVICGTASLGYLVKRLGRHSRWSEGRYPSLILATVGALALLVSLAGGAVNTWAMTNFQRVAGPRPTLDGLAWMLSGTSVDIGEWWLVKWMNENIVGTPVILEAFGPSYQDYTRIASRTGLPTVQGWDYHTLQRGSPHALIEQRKSDIAAIYSTEDPLLTLQLLKKYRVRYVVVGEVEYRTYPANGLAKFASMNSSLFPVFVRGRTVLYELR